MTTRLHQDQPVSHFGSDIRDAQLIVILLHGRGADAASMIPLAEALHLDGINFVIPQAAFNRWYPHSAFQPIETNEPDLSSAVEKIDAIIQDMHGRGFSNHQIAFGGFSQGACLAAEYVARNAQKFGGLFVYSGALIGPRDLPRNYRGSFAQMPVFIGGSDVDPWVPYDLLSNTARIFQEMDAKVDFRTYPGMDHTINQEEIDSVRSLLVNALKIPVV